MKIQYLEHSYSVRMKKEPEVITAFRDENKNLIGDVHQLVDSYPRVPLTVDCVVFGFDDNVLKVLLIESDISMFEGKWTLLGDFVQDEETLDDAAYRVFKDRTGMSDIYLEQVRAFSDPHRHPGGRVITIAYCSLVNIQHHTLKKLDHCLHWHSVHEIKDLAFDHDEIIKACYAWLQRRMQEHPLGLNLLPDKFSLRELQNLYEAILDIRFDRRNFRKKFFSMNLLIDTEEYEDDVPHRPGRLYRFDFEKFERQKRKWIGIDFA